MFNNKRESNVLPGSTQAAANSTSTDALLRELAVDYMNDKRKRRRWRMVFGICVLLYLFTVMFMTFKNNDATAVGKSHTALVELNGVIGTEMGISADQLNKSLRKAFAATSAKGIVLRINSPGGTPVQSAEISDEIVRLKQVYPDKPIYVVVSDMCASGGYFVAASADKIFANRSSIVGSIGVRMDSFGFVDAMKKYGIERRSITAGNNKAILDPFLPMNVTQRRHAEKMLGQVHQHFIDVVKQGRGDVLVDDPDLFSGLFWSGEDAKRLGLIDDYGSLDSVARDVIGAEMVVDYTVMPGFFDQFNRQFGVAIGKGIGSIFSTSQWQLH